MCPIGRIDRICPTVPLASRRDASGLPVCLWNASPCSASPPRHPGGMQACSRGLSAATPPDAPPPDRPDPGGVAAVRHASARFGRIELARRQRLELNIQTTRSDDGVSHLPVVIHPRRRRSPLRVKSSCSSIKIFRGTEMNFKIAIVFTGLVMVLFGCRAERTMHAIANIRLCIVTPDNQIHTFADENYAHWAEERHRSGDGSTPFQGIVLSGSQISQVLQLITENQTVPWATMTAVSPYPRSEMTVLVYRPHEEGLMCSMGGGAPAAHVLEQIIACASKGHPAEVQKSTEATRTAQPPPGGDGKPVPQP